MPKNVERDWDLLASNSLKVSSAIIGTVLSVADMLGLLDGTILEGLVPHITLICVAMLLAFGVLERSKPLTRVEEQLKHLAETLSGGFQYLKDNVTTTRALREMIQEARGPFMAVGGKSTNTSYLDQVGQMVSSGAIEYHRLLTGSHITHELHHHLALLLYSKAVKISWTFSEKYGTFTVSNTHTIVVLPSPHPDKFTGIKLVGPGNSLPYVQLFYEASREKSVPITTEAQLRILCESCSPNIARDEKDLISHLTHTPSP